MQLRTVLNCLLCTESQMQQYVNATEYCSRWIVQYIRIHDEIKLRGSTCISPQLAECNCHRPSWPETGTQRSLMYAGIVPTFVACATNMILKEIRLATMWHLTNIVIHCCFVAELNRTGAGCGVPSMRAKYDRLMWKGSDLLLETGRWITVA